MRANRSASQCSNHVVPNVCISLKVHSEIIVNQIKEVGKLTSVGGAVWNHGANGTRYNVNHAHRDRRAHTQARYIHSQPSSSQHCMPSRRPSPAACVCVFECVRARSHTSHHTIGKRASAIDEPWTFSVSRGTHVYMGVYNFCFVRPLPLFVVAFAFSRGSRIIRCWQIRLLFFFALLSEWNRTDSCAPFLPFSSVFISVQFTWNERARGATNGNVASSNNISESVDRSWDSFDLDKHYWTGLCILLQFFPWNFFRY